MTAVAKTPVLKSKLLKGAGSYRGSYMELL